MTFLLMLQIQLYGFNAELYHNMSEAEDKSQGIVGISLMVQVHKSTNSFTECVFLVFAVGECLSLWKWADKGLITRLPHCM